MVGNQILAMIPPRTGPGSDVEAGGYCKKYKGDGLRWLFATRSGDTGGQAKEKANPRPYIQFLPFFTGIFYDDGLHD